MPADITTENGKVRYNIGDTIEPYLLDDVVIDTLLAQYPDDTSEVRVWKATKDALRILKGRYANEASRRREREGSVEIEVYQNLNYGHICDLLDWYENNPPATIAGYNLHIFGGVSKKEKARVCNDPDSVLPPAFIGQYSRDDGEQYTPYDFIRSDV